MPTEPANQSDTTIAVQRDGQRPVRAAEQASSPRRWPRPRWPPQQRRRSPRPRSRAPPPPPGTAAGCRASRAPTARRMPISRVRSVTDTSMMFMMPTPPTTSDTLATEPSSMRHDHGDDPQHVGHFGAVVHGEIVHVAVADAVPLAEQLRRPRPRRRSCDRPSGPRRSRASTLLKVVPLTRFLIVV